jgi:hypothetical protein
LNLHNAHKSPFGCLMLAALLVLLALSAAPAASGAVTPGAVFLAQTNNDDDAKNVTLPKPPPVNPEDSDLMVELPSDDPLALYATAATKLAQGDQIEGLRLLRMATQKDPDNGLAAAGAEPHLFQSEKG